MSIDPLLPMTRLRELREAFDRTFAEPPPADAAPQDDFLAIAIAGDPYSIRLSAIGGLHAARAITALPGSVPAFLGLVGLSGTLMPVYDLGALLGYPKSAPPRWLAVVAGGRLALGFERFEGHLRVARDTLVEADPGEAAGRRPLVRECHKSGTAVRPIIHLPSVLEAVAVMVQGAARSKE